MLNEDSAAASQAQPSGAQAGTAQDCVPLPDPWGPVEGASTGTGTVTDPGGTDRKPPAIADLDLLA